MSKEITYLLEEAENLLKTEAFMECCAAERCEEYVTKALTLLKQQSTAGEFTKQVRKFVKLYENEIPRRAEITFLKEACVIIDQLQTLEQPEAGDFTKDIRLVLKEMSDDGKFHRKIMEKACDIIDTSEAINKDLLEACEDVRDTYKDLRDNGELKGGPTLLEAKIKAAIAKSKKEIVLSDEEKGVEK